MTRLNVFLIWPIFLIYSLIPLTRAYALPLTLRDCLQQAQLHSLQSVQSLVNEEKAKAAYEETSRARLPQLVGVANYEKSDDPVTQLPDANKVVARLEQSGFPFSPAWARGNQRQYEWRAATLAKLESTQDVAFLVKQLYFSILREKDAIERLRQVEGQLGRLLGSVIPRYTIGRAPPFDLIKIRTSVSDLQRTQELTQAQLASDQSTLAQIIGVPANSALELTIVTKMPELGEIAPSQLRLSDNPSLQVLEQQFLASRMGVTAARYGRVPSLIGSLEYGYSGQTADNLSLGWTVAVGLRLTVFDWGIVSAQVNQELANVSLAENRLEVERQKAISDLIQTHALANAHLSDQKRLSSLGNESRQAALISIDRYRRGGAGILETTDAVSLWIQTLLNERSAYYAYLTDLAKIDRLQGSKLYEDF